MHKFILMFIIYWKHADFNSDCIYLHFIRSQKFKMLCPLFYITSKKNTTDSSQCLGKNIFAFESESGFILIITCSNIYNWVIFFLTFPAPTHLQEYTWVHILFLTSLLFSTFLEFHWYLNQCLLRFWSVWSR